jgi:hypothetical protein
MSIVYNLKVWHKMPTKKNAPTNAEAYKNIKQIPRGESLAK